MHFGAGVSVYGTVIWYMVYCIADMCFGARVSVYGIVIWYMVYGIADMCFGARVSVDGIQCKKEHVFIFSEKTFFFLNIVQKNGFNDYFFIFCNLKKGKDISILWSAYSVNHIIHCIIQAVKHYINFIYIDSDSNHVMIFISKM